MQPLEVVARLAGAIAVPRDGIAIDAILAAAVALRDRIPPIGCGPLVEIEIPVAREPGGRFHLASVCYPEIDEYERRWINRRFPIEQAQLLGGEKLKRIQLANGHTKSYRLPYEAGHAARDELRWWCVGDEAEIRGLLELVDYVGRKRSVGLGRVESWDVRALRPEEHWDGFPLLRDGAPLRPLPLDWPGVAEERRDVRFGALSYPYWLAERYVECVGPMAGTTA